MCGGDEEEEEKEEEEEEEQIVITYFGPFHLQYNFPPLLVFFTDGAMKYNVDVCFSPPPPPSPPPLHLPYSQSSHFNHSYFVASLLQHSSSSSSSSPYPFPFSLRPNSNDVCV